MLPFLPGSDAGNFTPARLVSGIYELAARGAFPIAPLDGGNYPLLFVDHRRSTGDRPEGRFRQTRSTISGIPEPSEL
jgi:hypothetical protein